MAEDSPEPKNTTPESGTATARWSRLRKNLTLAAVLSGVLAGGSFVVSALGKTWVSDIWHWASNKPAFHPYVAVVASAELIEFTIPKEFLRGFEGRRNQKGELRTKDGRVVDVQTKEDLGDPEEAAQIARQLVADENCILVVGNSNSTLTATTLDIFLRSANPPSYIMPIATANDLITKAVAAHHGGVLRMVPDNGNQAGVIASTVKDLAPEGDVAIFSDVENTAYSVSLARDVAGRIRELGGHIVIEQAFGMTSPLFSALPVFRSSNPPKVIVYAGVAHHALLLVDQLAALQIETPVIFTDGCMVRPLIENAARMKNLALVLSPVGNRSEPATLPTYEVVGKDAFLLTDKLISACDDCTRANLRTLIGRSKETKTPDVTSIANGEAGSYSFNSYGNNIAMKYVVYEINKGALRAFSGRQGAR